MSDSSEAGAWGLRAVAVVGTFVFLNQIFGTENLGGLLEASWSDPLTWAGVGLGLLASVFLVESLRRADGKSPRWFVEVFAVIGIYAVGKDLVGNVLDPAVDPLLEPVYDAMPVWILLVAWVFCVGLGAYGVTRTIRRHWGGEGTGDGS